jgi:hypothetical protein
MDNYGTFNQRREHFKRIQGVTWADNDLGIVGFVDELTEDHIFAAISKLRDLIYSHLCKTGGTGDPAYYNGRTCDWWIALFQAELAFRHGTVGQVVTEPAVTDQQNLVSELCDRLMAHVASPCGRDLIFQIRSVAGAAGVTRYGAIASDTFVSDRIAREIH